MVGKDKTRLSVTFSKKELRRLKREASRLKSKLSAHIRGIVARYLREQAQS